MQRDLDLAAQALERLKLYGAEQADVIISAAQSLSVSCRLGQTEDIERAESRDIGLRAIIGQQQAFVSATGAEENMIDLLAERAVAMAKTAPADPYCGLADRALLATQFPELDIFDAFEPSSEDLEKMAHATEDVARAQDGITNSEGAGAAWGSGRTVLATSHGFSHGYQSSSFSLSCAVLGGTGDAMERDYASHASRHLDDLDKPETIGARAAQRTLARLNPRKLKSGKAPVVFDQRVSASLLGHFLGAISGSAVARGTSFLRNDLHNKIMPENITITDDPSRRRGMRSAAFDGEGLAAEQIDLVAQGVLASWLLDTATAKQLALKSNGRAGRGIGSPPSPSATNVHMNAGTLSVEEMMENLGSGLLVTELIGMGVNGVTGDYSRGAAGFWFEDGQIAYPVSEITIASNLRDMFAQLEPANDLNFRRGVNAPSILIPQMSLAGL